ncbi:hypothetical protein BD779DRAFT_1508499 [Infundibulicybe gibba]|nr:hypothetical protein BD779DRAFT_1508499 [Infundibulicybe gibba]
MSRFLRLLSVVALAASLASGTRTNSCLWHSTDPPQRPGDSGAGPVTIDINGASTDADTIAATAKVVDQKGGATDSTPPGAPVNATVVTAVDGQITTDQPISANSTLSVRSLSRRLLDGYEQVFSGTGTGPNDRDGSIEGTAYLTFTVVSNTTYNIDDCLSFCNRVAGCVFANLYYEFNNDLLDFVFNEKSNLKCAIYGDTHTADEKLNRGGQQLEAPPAGLTYIQQSSGFSSKTLVDPSPPDGYDLVFGPVDGANNAPGYMGFAFIDKYDVQACANLCNTRGADGVGGACQYFNIWRAVVNGNPTTYTCSFYYLVADESTAVNTGQGDLQVTFSRGYRRKNALIDGGFEGYAACDDFCFVDSYKGWNGTSPANGTVDASIFHFTSYAHTGSSVGLLGSATGIDALAGTLTPNAPLSTTAGKTYEISFFQQSVFSGEELEADSFIDVVWNGQTLKTIRPGFQAWTFHSVQVAAAPAWSFIDDVNVFEL